MTLPATGGKCRKPCSAGWDRIGGQMSGVVAATLVGRFVDQRVWRDGASPAEVGPPLPLLPGPIVVTLPQNFGQPPKSGQRLMHLRTGIGDGISAGSTEHEGHAPGNHEKPGGQGLLE